MNEETKLILQKINNADYKEISKKFAIFIRRQMKQISIVEKLLMYNEGYPRKGALMHKTLWKLAYKPRKLK